VEAVRVFSFLPQIFLFAIMSSLPVEVGIPGTTCRVLDFSDVSESDCESDACVKDTGPAARKKLTQKLKHHVVTPNAAVGAKKQNVDEIVCWNYKT
jgi:hypothetical protein